MIKHKYIDRKCRTFLCSQKLVEMKWDPGATITAGELDYCTET